MDGGRKGRVPASGQENMVMYQAGSAHGFERVWQRLLYRRCLGKVFDYDDLRSTLGDR